MAIHISDVKRYATTDCYWRLYEIHNDLGFWRILFESAPFGPNGHIPLDRYTVYTSANATFLFVLVKKTLAPITLDFNFTSLPEFFTILQLEFTSAFNGSLSTPDWDGVTSQRWVMNTWVKIRIPQGHDVMVSMFDVVTGFSSRCRTDFHLGLYADPRSQPLDFHCEPGIAGPSAFRGLHSALFIRFVAGFQAATRFKMHFSIHPTRAMLSQIGDKWNCSVWNWPDFRLHFPCNAQAECLQGEDECRCHYTTARCGPGHVTIGRLCYWYRANKSTKSRQLLFNRMFHNEFHAVFSPLSAVTLAMAQKQCLQIGGVLPRLKSYRDVMDLRQFQFDKGSFPSFFTGITSPKTSLPFLYSSVWVHTDGSIAHYVGPIQLPVISIAGCDSMWYNRVVIHEGVFKKTCVHVNDEEFAYLCEIPDTTRHTRPPFPRLSPLTQQQNRFWWNQNRFWQCPSGHVTHLFMACDLQTSCWANDFSTSAFCSLPVHPVPPSLGCDNGLLQTPYSLVCDGQPDCYDGTDELLCVYIPCEATEQFTCSDRMCVPEAVVCDGAADCRDGSDEYGCPQSSGHHDRTTSVPPAILLFDGLGGSSVLPLSTALKLNVSDFVGSLLNVTLNDVTLVADTLINATFDNGTLVSGVVVSGLLTNGTAVSGTEAGSARVRRVLVTGTRVSGWVVNATWRKGPAGGTLLGATVMGGVAVCPDTHFRCADDSYCVPVFTRCNDLFDCPGHEDEAGCHSYQCPGFYRCRGSRVCLHRRDVCDGVFHCPRSDDELLCDVTCPYGCTCYGWAFFCPRATRLSSYPELRYLDAGRSKMSVRDSVDNTMLVHLSLAHCDVTVWGPVRLPNLRSLDLSDNNITGLSGHLFRHLPRLEHLALARNPLTLVLPDSESRWSSPSLRSLDLSGVFLPDLNVTALNVFPDLSTLNLTGCGVDRVLGGDRQAFHELHVLDARGCPLTRLPGKWLRGMRLLKGVKGDNPKLCCPSVLPLGFPPSRCTAPADLLSSCHALLRATLFRACLYVFAISSWLGNASSVAFRLLLCRHKPCTGFDVFVVNLCVSDFLMGVYLVVIGVADRVYEGSYLWFELTWRHSACCHLAGFLSMVSSEVSAFIICFITLDRFLALRFPFSQLRFSATTAYITSGLIWAVCLVIATVPLLPVTSHWQFYSQTGICIPLPTSRKAFEGKHYAFGVMIALNFVLFLVVALGQVVVYLSVRAHKMAVCVDSGRATNKDLTLARRLITVAVSDFLCWFPVGLVGIMTANGYDVSGEVNVAMAVFVLPLNSAVNPFLYTLNLVLEKRRHTREQRLRQFVTSNLKTQPAPRANVAQFGSNCRREEAEQMLKIWLDKGILSTERITSLQNEGLPS